MSIRVNFRRDWFMHGYFKALVAKIGRRLLLVLLTVFSKAAERVVEKVGMLNIWLGCLQIVVIMVADIVVVICVRIYQSNIKIIHI